MAINERLIHTASDAAGGGTGNQEEGLILHLDANDVDSYDGDGDIWYDITNHEYTPAVDPSENFNTATFIGNGSTNSITGVGFQPDLVWLKHRSGGSPAATNHYLYDSVRGNTKVLFPNLTLAESEDNHITSFDVDGFTLGNDAAANANNANYVAWCFKAGGAPTATNTATSGAMTANSVSIDGELQSAYTPSGSPNIYPTEMSVNTKLGFSIIRVSSNLPSNSSYPHGLDNPPEMIITKSASSSGDWYSWHKDIGAKYINLNSNAAAVSGEYVRPNANTVLNPNSGAFQVGSDTIIYAFHTVRGVSKVGSYTGTGAAGNKVYTGFQPAWIMFKRTNSTSDWNIVDNQTSTSGFNKYLRPNSSAVEATPSTTINIEADGFSFNGSSFNSSGGNWIYLAFAAEKATSLIEEVTTTDSYSYYGTENFYDYISSITSTSTSSTFDATNLQDSTATVGFGNNGNTEANNTINFTMTQPVSVDGFLVGESEQSYYGYTGTCKFYGSTDGSTYTLLGSTQQKSSGFALNPTRTEKTATFSATPGYSHFRMTLSNMTRGTYGNIYDFIPSVADNDFDFVTTTGADPVLHLDAGNTDSYDPSSDGSTWSDLTTGGHNATLTSMDANQHDKEIGGWFDFDGVNDHAVVPHFSELESSARTYEFWVNFDVLGTQFFAGTYGGTNATRGFMFRMFGASPQNTIRAQVYSGTGTDSEPTGTKVIEAGKWYHIVFVSDNSDRSFKSYINGELDINQTLSFDVNTSSTEPFSLGRGGSGYTINRINGKIGQVRIYSSAITADEVMQNYRFTKNDYPNEFHLTGNNMDSSDWNSSGYFDFATNEYFEASTSSILKAESTVIVWCSHDGGNSQMLFSNGTGDDTGMFVGTSSTGQIRIGQTTAANDFTFDSTLKHYAFVFSVSDGNVKVYKNGVLQTTRSHSQAGFFYASDQSSWTTNFRIGRQLATYGEYWDGKVGYVKVYDRTLSQSEIEADYDATKSTYE